MIAFLKTHYEEVARILNLQYDQEAEHRAIREEEYESGRLLGNEEKAIEMAKKMLSDNLPLEKISEYTGLSVGVLENFKNVME